MRGRRPAVLYERIIEIKRKIVASGANGITQKMLREELSIPRTTANRCCKVLEKEGKINVIREGRGARYIAKSNMVMDPEMGSYIMGKEAYFKIMKRTLHVPMSIITEEIDDTGRMEYVEQGLSNFSTVLGAILTYVLLDAMSQGNPVLRREYHRKGPYYMNRRRKDQLVRKWIDGFLSGMLTFTPFAFREFLYKETGRYRIEDKYRKYRARKPFDPKRPALSIKDPEVVNLSHRAFQKIYPEIYGRMDRVSKELTNAIKSEKASLEAFEKRSSSSPQSAPHEAIEKNKVKLRGTKAHEHKFKLLKVKDNLKYFQCETCGKRKNEPTITL